MITKRVSVNEALICLKLVTKLTKHNQFDILRFMTQFETTTTDPYTERRSDVLQAASALYRAGRDGIEIDMEDPASRVNPKVSGDPKELHAAEARAAELTISARTAARVASLLDQAEGGETLRSRTLARVELFGQRVFEPREYRRVTGPGSIVNSLRLPHQVADIREDLRQDRAEK